MSVQGHPEAEAQDQPHPPGVLAAEAEPVRADPHYARRWLVLAVVLTAQVMILLDGTVVNVALPSAQRALGFSDAARPWVITAYVLAFGSLLPLGGRLADVVGRKTMFMTGLVGFALASAVAGAAPTIGTLLAARAVQGAFAAARAPAALSLLVVTFTDLKELNKAFAIFGAVAGSAGAIGLLLGGVLTDYASWRWCMYINIIFAVIAGAGGLSLLHNSRDANRPRLSIPSTILGSAALFGLVFGSAQAETSGWGWGHHHVAGRWRRSAGHLRGPAEVREAPAIPLRVIADRNRGAAYLALFLTYGAMFAVFLFLTYYIQDVKGYSPIITGVGSCRSLSQSEGRHHHPGPAAAAPHHAHHRLRRAHPGCRRSRPAHPGRRHQQLRSLAAAQHDPHGHRHRLRRCRRHRNRPAGRRTPDACTAAR